MVNVRAMTIDDYAEVIVLWQQSSGMTLREADSRENIGRYLQQNSGLSFVAEVEQQVVGAVLAGTDGRRGYLQHLAVSTASQSNGIGRTLVEHVLSALQQQGVDKTHLFVHSDNQQAQAFYQKLGWFARPEVQMYSFNSSNVENI